MALLDGGERGTTAMTEKVSELLMRALPTSLFMGTVTSGARCSTDGSTPKTRSDLQDHSDHIPIHSGQQQNIAPITKYNARCIRSRCVCRSRSRAQ